MLKKLIGRLRGRAKRALRPWIQRYGYRPPTLTPRYWSLEDDSVSGLSLQGVSLDSLVKKWGSPLHVVDAQALRANASRFLRPHGVASGCEVFYSYKTNPVPGVLRVLHDAGIHAEVISHQELWLARQLGIAPEHIVYNGPGKSLESLREAVALGIQVININHAEEVERVAAVARELGRRPRVGLRITTGGGWTAQFGTPVDNGAALRAFAAARDTGVLDVVGVHAHLGGMIHDRGTLLWAVGSVLDFVEQLERQHGIALEILNFGGSLATPTVKHDSALDRRLNQTFHRPLPEPDATQSLGIEDYVTCLMQAVRERYARRGRPAPRVFIEPGRSMTGNTQMLIASVISTKQVTDGSFLILDAGINIAESARGEYHKMFAVRGWGEPATETYTVVGPICSPADTLVYAWPCRRLAEGDQLVIMDAGAYFVPFSTSFSFPRPAIVMLDGGREGLLRRAERFEDLIALDTGP